MTTPDKPCSTDGLFYLEGRGFAYPVKVLAETLDVGESRIQQYIKEGRFTDVMRVGRSYLVIMQPDDLERLVETQTQRRKRYGSGKPKPDDVTAED